MKGEAWAETSGLQGGEGSRQREQHVQRPWGRRLLKEEQTSETGRERGREEVAGDKMGVPERVLGRGVA